MEDLEKRTKERSAMYPSISWNEAFDFIKKIDQVGGKAVSYTTIASAYNLNSANNNNLKARISTSRQFSFITVDSNTIKLTDSARRLLYPTSNIDTKAYKQSCFSSPPLYKKLIERFEGKALPTQGLLENILMNDYEITRNAKEIAAKSFLLSVEQLGFAKAGVLLFENANETVEPPAETNAADTATKEPNQITPTIAVVPSQTQVDYFKLDIPLQSGKPAHIYLPIDASKEDAELIRDMLNVILKRRYGIDT